jgi:hypothetical protein
MIYFSVMLFLLGLLFYLSLWRKTARGGLIVTPFMLFAAHEIFFNWYASLYLYQVGVSPDGYAALVVAVAFLAFLCGYSFFQRQQQLVVDYRDLPVHRRFPENYYLTGAAFVGFILIGLAIYLYNGIPPVTQVLVQFVFSDELDAQAIASFTSDSRYELTKSHWFDGDYRGQGAINSIMQIGCVVSISCWQRNTGAFLVVSRFDNDINLPLLQGHTC